MSEPDIRAILDAVRTIAVLGASPKRERPSNDVIRFLIERGYDVCAVNPGHAGHEINGRPCYATLADVPYNIDMVDVFRASDAVPSVVNEVLALERKPSVLWLQLGVRHDEAAARARADGLIVVQNKCPKIEIARLGL